MPGKNELPLDTEHSVAYHSPMSDVEHNYLKNSMPNLPTKLHYNNSAKYHSMPKMKTIDHIETY